jgi:starvation-inducible DNA-binding protein
MEELVASLRIALSNTFMMYFKAHSHHWNVEGENFAQYHDFLGDLYQEVFEAVDGLAEQMRALDAYAPISLSTLYTSKTTSEDLTRSESFRVMVGSLMGDNDQVLQALNKTFELAERENKQGLADFIAGRIDAHNKHGWMLRSFTK